MKRLFTLAFFPALLFALEPVNLIKDAGFEKDSDMWQMYSEANGPYDSTIIERHDPDSVYVGSYCGSIDTRIKPQQTTPNSYSEHGYLYQLIAFPKKLEDLDSLELSHMVILRQEDRKSSSWEYALKLSLHNPDGGTRIEAIYFWIAPDLEPAGDGPTYKVFPDTIYDEKIWYTAQRSIEDDLVKTKSLSSEIILDTFILCGYGLCWGDWRGQKVFFDGIRLTGYADYDVGVKEILSGDSLWAGVGYTPAARIKNFGREAADDFLVIAEIRQAETTVWADTVPYTLPADTEDTLEFASFPVPDAASYTLTVRTIMDPDESDEDDELSKPLYGTAIAENPQPQAISLEVGSFTANPKISYSLPAGQPGVLRVYDASGRKVENLRVQGSGEIGFPSALSSGVYFVKLETGKTNITRKAIVLK